MLCTKCNTSNSSDYNFCRECGASLAGAGGSAAPNPQTEQLLARAFTLLDQGLLDDARDAALAALAIEPDGVSAHSVLGLIYEREGKIPEAIREYEIVLERNPKSTADRLKLEALRGERTGAIPARRWTPQRVAVTSAVAAAAVVFGGGYLVITQLNQTDTHRQVSSSTTTNQPGSLQPANTSASGNGTAQPLRPLLPTPPTPLVQGAPLTAGPSPVRTGNTPVMPVTGAVRPSMTLRPSAPIGPLALPGSGDRTAAAAPTGLGPAAIGEVVPIPQTPAVAPGNPSALPGTAAVPATTGTSAPTPAPTAPTIGASAAAHDGDNPGEKPKREPLEPETGFIRIEPIAVGKETRAVGAAPKGPPPTISLNFTATEAESVTLTDAQRAQRNGQIARRTNAAEAERHFRQAIGLFEILVRRGGSSAKQAREGLEECRKALAAVR